VLSVEFAFSPIDSYELPRLARALDYRSRDVRDPPQAELRWNVDVRPVVVINGHFPQRVVRAERLTYVAVEALAAGLASEPRRIASTDLAVVVHAVQTLEPAPILPVSMRRIPRAANHHAAAQPRMFEARPRGTPGGRELGGRYCLPLQPRL
jgi:hypothetical protein